MKTMTKFLVLLVLILSAEQINAQDNIPNEKNAQKIETLEKTKESIKTEERDLLKTEVEAINQRLDKREITLEEAELLKNEVAKKRALNIENRLAIVDNKIDLLKRNDDESFSNDDIEQGVTIHLGRSDDNDNVIHIGEGRKDRSRKYDRRTTSDLVIAFGLNNTIIEGEKLDDSPYEIGGSRFFEMGWAWKTRVFNNSNFVRFKYGFSFQTNGLKPTDNMYFVQDGNQTTLEEFQHDLRKSKLSVSNLVIPIHFEFGPSKKVERDTYFRYYTNKQFKIGIGGYAGFNIGTRQKLKYSVNGDKVKDKIKRDYNTSNLVYGLSGYLAFGDTALYIKYDLSPLFKDQVIDQNNISLGVRFDMD